MNTRIRHAAVHPIQKLELLSPPKGKHLLRCNMSGGPRARAAMTRCSVRPTKHLTPRKVARQCRSCSTVSHHDCRFPPAFTELFSYHRNERKKPDLPIRPDESRLDGVELSQREGNRGRLDLGTTDVDTAPNKLGLDGRILY